MVRTSLFRLSFVFLFILPFASAYSIEHEMLTYQTNKGYMEIISHDQLVGKIGMFVNSTSPFSLFSNQIDTDSYIWTWNNITNREGTILTAYNNNIQLNITQEWKFYNNKDTKFSYYITNNLFTSLTDTEMGFTNSIGTPISKEDNVVVYDRFSFDYNDIVDSGLSVSDQLNTDNSLVSIDLGTVSGLSRIELDPTLTAYKSPTVTDDPQNDWTNGVNIKSSNNAYATETTIGHNESTSRFVFGIPLDSDIHGIQCQIEGKGVGGLRFNNVRIDMGLSYDGGTSLTALKGQVWGLAERYKTYGGVSDTWGRAWTAEELSNANFESRIKLGSLGGIMNSFSADHLRCRVNYTVQIPQLTFVSQTPDNDTTIGSSLKLNITSDYALENCKVNHNKTGTFQNTSLTIYDDNDGCYGYIGGITTGETIQFTVYGDSGGVENFTETRIVHVVNTIPQLTVSLLENNTLDSTTYRLLNFTMNDSEGDYVEVNIYASDTPSIGGEAIIYKELIDTFSTPEDHTFNFSFPLTQYGDNVHALYHLDNRSSYGENNTHVHDFSGNNITGILTAVTVQKYSKFGGGLSNFGYLKKVVLGNSTAFKDVCDNGCTFSAWVKPEEIGSSGHTIISRSKSITSTSFFYVYIKSTGEIVFILKETGATSGGSCSVTTPIFSGWNEWHNILATFNESDASIYIDGIFNTSALCSFTEVNETKWEQEAELWLGERESAASSYYGEMDEVAILNDSLNSSEVSELFALRTGSTYYWNVTATDFVLTNSTDIFQFTIEEEGVLCLYDCSITNKITSDVNCLDNDLIFSNAGRIEIDADFYNVNRIIGSSCRLDIALGHTIS